MPHKITGNIKKPRLDNAKTKYESNLKRTNDTRNNTQNSQMNSKGNIFMYQQVYFKSLSMA